MPPYVLPILRRNVLPWVTSGLVVLKARQGGFSLGGNVTCSGTGWRSVAQPPAPLSHVQDVFHAT